MRGHELSVLFCALVYLIAVPNNTSSPAQTGACHALLHEPNTDHVGLGRSDSEIMGYARAKSFAKLQRAQRLRTSGRRERG